MKPEQIPDEIVETAARAFVLHLRSGDASAPATIDGAVILFSPPLRAALAAAWQEIAKAEREAILGIVQVKAISIKRRIGGLLHNDEFEEAESLGRYLKALEGIFSEIRARKDAP